MGGSMNIVSLRTCFISAIIAVSFTYGLESHASTTKIYCPAPDTIKVTGSSKYGYTYYGYTTGDLTKQLKFESEDIITTPLTRISPFQAINVAREGEALFCAYDPTMGLVLAAYPHFKGCTQSEGCKNSHPDIKKCYFICTDVKEREK